MQLYNISMSQSTDELGIIVCFNHNVLVNTCTSIQSLVYVVDDTRVVVDTAMMREYLDHSNVLIKELPSLEQIKQRVKVYRARTTGNSHGRSVTLNNVGIPELTDENPSTEHILNELTSNSIGTNTDSDSDSDLPTDDDDNDNKDGAEEGNVPYVNNFCGTHNCHRMFPHSHVGGGGNDNVFGIVHRDGIEAMSEDFYSKV